VAILTYLGYNFLDRFSTTEAERRGRSATAESLRRPRAAGADASVGAAVPAFCWMSDEPGDWPPDRKGGRHRATPAMSEIHNRAAPVDERNPYQKLNPDLIPTLHKQGKLSSGRDWSGVDGFGVARRFDREAQVATLGARWDAHAPEDVARDYPTAVAALRGLGEHRNVVQDMLGHSSIAQTLDTYSHMVPALHREVALHMDRLFSAPMDAVSSVDARVDAHGAQNGSSEQDAI